MRQRIGAPLGDRLEEQTGGCRSTEVRRFPVAQSWHTPAASKSHAMTRVASVKWWSEQVSSGVEQRMINTLNPLATGSIPSRPF